MKKMLSLLALLACSAPAFADDARYYLRPDGKVERRVADLERRVAEIEKKLNPSAAPTAPEPRAAEASETTPEAARPQDAAVAIDLGDHGGSGTVIHAEGGRSVVLTNRHVTDCGGPVTVTHAGQTYPAERLAYHEHADLGLVVVRADLPAAELAPADPAPGTPVRMWARTTHYVEGATLAGTAFASGPTGLATYRTESGDSGAGVFDAAGRLVGVNWGFMGTYASRGPSGYVPVTVAAAFVEVRAAGLFPRLKARLAARKAAKAAAKAAAKDAAGKAAARPDPKKYPDGNCPDGKCDPKAAPKPAPKKKAEAPVDRVPWLINGQLEWWPRGVTPQVAQPPVVRFNPGAFPVTGGLPGCAGGACPPARSR